MSTTLVDVRPPTDLLQVRPRGARKNRSALAAAAIGAGGFDLDLYHMYVLHLSETADEAYLADAFAAFADETQEWAQASLPVALENWPEA